jgi:hypothetical protein
MNQLFLVHIRLQQPCGCRRRDHGFVVTCFSTLVRLQLLSSYQLLQEPDSIPFWCIMPHSPIMIEIDTLFSLHRGERTTPDLVARSRRTHPSISRAFALSKILLSGSYRKFPSIGAFTGASVVLTVKCPNSKLFHGVCSGLPTSLEAGLQLLIRGTFNHREPLTFSLWEAQRLNTYGTRSSCVRRPRFRVLSSLLLSIYWGHHNWPWSYARLAWAELLTMSTGGCRIRSLHHKLMSSTDRCYTIYCYTWDLGSCPMCTSKKRAVLEGGRWWNGL